MKNKLLKISILAIIFVMLMQVVSFASLGSLTLLVKTDKDSYEIGEKVTVTVDWTSEMQAAGFTLKYDKDTLAFDSTTLGGNYYNADTAGEILFNWASFDGNNLTNVSFVLLTTAAGSPVISIEEPKGFADESMDQPSGYTHNNKTITIAAKQEEQKPDEQPEQKPDDQPEQKPDTKPEIVTLESISITKTPTRNTYLEGEKFETKGIEITAKYSDGTSKVVTNYTYSPNGKLKTTDKKIVISYTEDGVTKTVEQKITVTPYGAGSTEGETNNNQQPNNNKQPDNTTADGKIPQAGLNTMELFAIALFAVVGIVAFKGYRRLADI